MKKFKTFLNYIEYLTEMSVAGYGDWVPSRDRILLKSSKQLKAEWHFIETVKIQKLELDLYKMNTEQTYILGVLDSEGFETIFHIELKRRKDLESVFHYKNIVNVDGVIVEKNMRGYGIAKFMYKYFVNKMNFSILGDEIQYHKARLTWASLSKMDGVIVDIIDIESDKVLEKDVVLHHGEVDYDFDERIWDYDDIKKNIRLILTKVKD